MMVRCCPTRCDSWVCPRCGRRLGARLAERLVRRLDHYRSLGYVAYMLTLTFDRKRPLFADPVRLWQYVSDNRPFARAIRKFGKAWGCEPIYFAKKELHRSGHVHLHCLLLLPERLGNLQREYVKGERLAGVFPLGPMRKNGKRYPEFAEWGHGHTSVSKLYGSAAVGYVTKYVAKPVDCDMSFLESLPARGLRWTTCSKQFWGPSENRLCRSKSGEDDGGDVPAWVSEGESGCDATAEAGACDGDAADGPATLAVRLAACGGGTRMVMVELPRVVRDNVPVRCERGVPVEFVVDRASSVNRLFYTDLGSLSGLGVGQLEMLLLSFGAERLPDGLWEVEPGALAALLWSMRPIHRGGCKRALGGLPWASGVEDARRRGQVAA